MKRLLLARHAKSSWDHPDLSDKERPLNPRGRDSAPKVGQALLDGDLQPEVVLSSTSQRTRETWELMEGLFPGTVVDFRDSLYLASPGELLSVISGADDQVTTLMTLAHNPGTHALAVALAQSGTPDDVLALRSKFPTGAVAVIELPIERWQDAGSGGRLVGFVRPRLLD